TGPLRLVLRRYTVDIPDSEGKGRLAVVLGGANGIGAATCRRLHAYGWKIVVADIDLPGAQALAQECGGASLRFDVLDAQSIAHAAQAIEEQHGPVYALVNSAAIFQPQKRPEDLPLEVWERIVDSAYRGTYV